MKPIGKTFEHQDDIYTVVEQTPIHFICRSKADQKLWLFSFDEVRAILEGK